MKQVVTVIISLGVIIILSFVQMKYLKSTSRYILTDIRDIKNSVEREDLESAKNASYELEKTWEKIKGAWDIFGEHDDIQTVDDKIITIKEYAKLKKKEEIIVETANLENLILHIIESEKLSFSNVL